MLDTISRSNKILPSDHLHYIQTNVTITHISVRYLSSLPVGVRKIQLGFANLNSWKPFLCYIWNRMWYLHHTKNNFQVNIHWVLLITSILHKSHIKFQEKLSDRCRVIHPKQNSTTENPVRLICRSILLTEVHMRTVDDDKAHHIYCI